MNATIDARLTSLERTVAQLVAAIGLGPGGGSAAGTDATQQRYRLSDAQLSRLAQKLDEFGERLEDAEKATLLSVLGAAAAKFEEAGATDGFAKGVEIFAQGQLDQVSLGEALETLGKVDHGSGDGMDGDLESSVSGGVDIACVHGDWSKELSLESATGSEQGAWSTGKGTQSYTGGPAPVKPEPGKGASGKGSSGKSSGGGFATGPRP